MKNKKLKILALVFILICVMACVFACGQNGNETDVPQGEYDESNFKGSGMVGIPGIFDRVGYGVESSYDFLEDNSVTLNSSFYAPLKNSMSAEGQIVQATISRADGEKVASQSPLTGAIYFQSGKKRYRIYILGENTEYSYLVINGIDSSVTPNVKYERRYKIPLASYKTGEKVSLKVVLVNGECNLTITTEASNIYYKITDKTSYESTSGTDTSLVDFFDDSEKAIGLESLDVKANFKDISFSLGTEKAVAELDKQELTVGIVNVSDGKNSTEGGIVSVSEDEPVRGSNITVNVSIEDGYYLNSLKINDLDCKNKLVVNGDNYTYQIYGIQRDTVITATFNKGEETKYRISGKYTYTSGTYDEISGQCINEGDTLSVSAGIYSGTASDGAFEIYLPAGEHFINLESEFYPVETKQITVEGDSDDVEIEFGKIKFSTEMRYNADDSVTFSTNNMIRMIEGAVADEGFVFEYTVTGGVGAWFNTGGLYITYDDKSVSGDKEIDVVNFDYIFIYNTSKKAEVVLIQQIKRSDNGPAYLTTYPYTSLKDTIKVTIVYYNETYYFVFDDKYAVEINKYTALNTQQGTLNKAKFFGEKTRRLGLRNYDSSATFSSVSYKLGNAAAMAEIALMTSKYTLSTTSGGTAQFVENGKTLNQDYYQKTIGNDLSVIIKPEDGKFIDKFTVAGEDKKSLLQGPFVQYDANGTNPKRIYRYDSTLLKGGGDINVSFADTETKYSVQGRYSVANGTQNITVKSEGEYVGTASSGTFSIDLPIGTHVITFETLDGQLATRRIVVDGAKDYSGDLGEVILSTVKMELETGIDQIDDDTYVINYGVGDAHHYFEAGGERIDAAGAFVVEFTMQNIASSNFYKSCALFSLKGGTTNAFFILKIGTGAYIGLYDPNCGDNPDGSAYYIVSEANYKETNVTRVKIAYYKNEYYISFDGANPVKITEQDMVSNLLYANQISAEFFTSGIRTLGIRIKDTGSTVSDISVKLGDENVKNAVKAMAGFENVE